MKVYGSLMTSQPPTASHHPPGPEDRQVQEGPVTSVADSKGEDQQQRLASCAGTEAN